MIDADMRNGLIAAIVAVGLWLIFVEQTRDASTGDVLINCIVIGLLTFALAFLIGGAYRGSRHRKRRR